jgi:FixJ family two-component response regulator
MIAVVDDDESVRNAVLRLLQAPGVSLRVPSLPASNSSSLGPPIDLVYLGPADARSGNDLQRALRAGARIPIIIATARDCSCGVREERDTRSFASLFEFR